MSPTESNKTPSTEVTTKFLATLNYYLEPEKGGSNTYFHGSGNDPELNQYDSAEVYIHNIRGREPDFRLDEHGFEVLQNVEIMRSSDPTYFENEYYAIIARTLMAKLRATEVVVTSNIRRIRKVNPRRPSSIPIPYASLVHVDQSYSGARVKYSSKYPQFAERFDNSRWAVINWWQPIENPATRMPLALCDGRSIAAEDWREITATSPKLPLLELRSDGPEPFSDTGAAPKRSNPDHGMWRVAKPRSPDEHKWYFLQDMQLHEALLIKIFDSQREGVSRRTPHSAFESPFDHGPERTSIEFRCLVFWDSKLAQRV